MRYVLLPLCLIGIAASAPVQPALPKVSGSTLPTSREPIRPVFRRPSLAPIYSRAVSAADCEACHTAPGGKPFAGGLPFKLPMIVTIYSANITPDRETGIGACTDAEFLKALHQVLACAASTNIPCFPIRPMC